MSAEQHLITKRLFLGFHDRITNILNFLSEKNENVIIFYTSAAIDKIRIFLYYLLSFL